MLHDKLKKLMAKKKDMPDNEKKAKMAVVGNLRDLASDEMKNRLAGKVSVASNSKEGLKKGLDLAKENLDDSDSGYSEGGKIETKHPSLDLSPGNTGKTYQDEEESEDKDSPSEEASESPVEEAGENVDEQSMRHEEGSPHPSDQSTDMMEEMSEEELDKKLQHLMDLKKKRSSK